jgi:hypothetical protein
MRRKHSTRRVSARLRSILPQMKQLGREGSYREAIRAFLTLPFQRNNPPITGHRAELYLQYAVALQHAGLFGLAKDLYERVAEARPASRSAKVTAAVYNARLQLAVLRERFGHAGAALELLNEIGPPNARDLGLARASLRSWASTTRMKSLLALDRRRELRQVATALQSSVDWNERIWSALFLAILDRGSRSHTARKAALEQMRGAISDMMILDAPGAPWVLLLAAKHVRSSGLARELLEEAHRQATRMGKFFVIAEAAELLAQNSTVPRHSREWYLRRAISAYARCGLLLLLPFSQRLFRAAESFWGEQAAQQSILQSAHLLESREKLVFSKMCRRLAAAKRYGSKPWQVFEEFVKDWALARYPGKYKDVAAGEATADALIIQKNGTIVLQAKHVSSPRREIPDTLYFRKLYQIHRIPPIKRYIFVVTSSRPNGWTDDLWSAGLTEMLQNKTLEQKIKVDVVREPELQTDVLLDDHLYDKYFAATRGDGR